MHNYPTHSYDNLIFEHTKDDKINRTQYEYPYLQELKI